MAAAILAACLSMPTCAGDHPEDAAECRRQGGEYAYTEENAEEKIIHCTKPHKGQEAALQALRKSELGRRIADFLVSHHIPIRATDQNLGPGVGAVFLWRTKEIQIPRNAAELDATVLAVALAHEGYHAMQAIKEEMVQCIEAEQDAFFVHFVVYVEMTRAGVRPIPDNAPFANDLKYIASGVRKGDMSSFEEATKLAYEQQRDRLLHSGDWLRPIGRIVAAISIRAFDFLFDFTEGFETLDRKQRHVAYWWDTTSIRRTRVAHQRAVEWKEKWIGDHRHDNLGPL